MTEKQKADAFKRVLFSIVRDGSRPSAEAYRSAFQAFVDVTQDIDWKPAVGSGRTLFMLSMSNGRFDAADVLLGNFHSDINATDRDGWTSLMIATNARLFDSVNFLLSRGADRSIKSTRLFSLFPAGSTALDIAKEIGSEAGVSLLKPLPPAPSAPPLSSTGR